MTSRPPAATDTAVAQNRTRQEQPMSSHLSSPAWSSLNKVGLALTILLSIGNIASALGPTPEGESGPPLGVLLAGSILGVIGTVAGILAWVTNNRAAARLAAITIVLCAISALPAFFVDVPAGVKAMVAVLVLLTVTAVALTFSARRNAR